MVVVEELDVETTTLDRFAQTLSDDHVDFIKIDVEGSELDVLRGGKSHASHDKRVLAIKTEFSWDSVLQGVSPHSPIWTLSCARMASICSIWKCITTKPTCAAVCRQAGWRRLRNAPTRPRQPPARSNRATAKALTRRRHVFRDPVTDRTAGRTSIAWIPLALLRLCTLFDLFNYGDCAIELLQDFHQHKVLDFDFDVEKVIDALTPEVMVGPDKGVVVGYAKYRSMSEDVRKRMDTKQRAIVLSSSR